MNAITEIKAPRFNAEVMPLYGPNGRILPASIGRAVVRNDTGETIAVCGPNFAPVQHHDITDPIFDHLAAQGYEVEERAKSKHDLYDLQGRKGAFVQSATTDNGAVMRTDVILGDFINPTGRSHYLQEGADTMLFKISIFNSHNSSLAVRVVTSYERLICLNGMTSPSFSAGVYGKHTNSFNLDAMTKKIEASMNAMSGDADKFGMWARTKLTVQQADEFLQRTVAKLRDKPNGEANFSQPLVNKILEQYHREDQTVWGLFQAVTHWQSHGERREGSDALKTTIGRESRVASMLRTKEWAGLLAA